VTKRTDLTPRVRRAILISLCLLSLPIAATLAGSKAGAFTDSPRLAIASRGSEGTWCGSSDAFDWVCRWHGAVFSDGSLLAKRIPAPSGKSVVTGPRSEAHLSFRNQANCTLGESSQIYPRDGAPNSLFSQQYGSSSCTSRLSRSAVRLLCGPAEPCPAEVRAKGTILLAFPLPGAAGASSTEALSRRVRIVLCAGFLRVTTADGDEAAGGATGNNRYVIVVEELSKHTVEEGLDEAERSTSINVIGKLAGAGDCTEPMVEAQESTTYGF
jgi:hypothetical protein